MGGVPHEQILVAPLVPPVQKPSRRLGTIVNAVICPISALLYVIWIPSKF